MSLLTMDNLNRQAAKITLLEMLGVLLRLQQEYSWTELHEMIHEAGERLKTDQRPTQ